MTRDIGFFIFPDFQILDLTGPLAAFQIAGMVAEAEHYRLHVLSQHGGGVTATAGLEVVTKPVDARRLDTLIIAGGRGTRPAAQPPGRLAAVRSAASGARRVASVCTGAFILAATGLLDGRSATTHWRHAASLQRHYPSIRVDGDRIFVKDGPVWTSAGITAGIDLALAMIEEDHGSALARTVARELVVYHRRPGGQSQFSAMLDLEPDSDRVRQVLSFAREHLGEALPVERLAEAACLSPRQFGRVFRAETDETPARAVERLRAEAARMRVEAGTEPIEAIAASVGFADPERMRRAFLRRFGQPPQAIKRATRMGSPVPSVSRPR
ncbi:GlxA family transcriptional regulator [Acidiphilium sp. AL]|uniref:GlxA family transcriptional regulator n=1 Tax=Acidiphilium iwatense TaxID=768198 RepID=A0ABS9DZT2_9PROT|nr:MULTISPECIES: GlxA family transcriptional regulator [Acidiphilium]MCF3947598.1 GlxA family transcriptional regulator [Acidiphilium iwatense]MCU4160764.1 GlxA family transcriptional regulator [Acidiphilium sp. AL]